MTILSTLLLGSANALEITNAYIGGDAATQRTLGEASSPDETTQSTAGSVSIMLEAAEGSFFASIGLTSNSNVAGGREDFGAQILNSTPETSNIVLDLRKVWFYKHGVSSGLGINPYIASNFTTWEDTANGAGTGDVAVVSAGLPLSFTYDVASEVGVEDQEIVLKGNVGIATRLLAQDFDFALAALGPDADTLLDSAVWFGPEAHIEIKVNGVAFYSRFTWFDLADTNKLPGLTNGRFVAGARIEGSLLNL